MEFQNIQTVEELTNALEQFPKELPISIFDETQGYISVAFKKETTERNGQTFQWLNFYPNQEIKLYTVRTLIGYLERLPKPARITTKDPNGDYTPLFLSVDKTIEQGEKFQWVVISDQVNYERFFLGLIETDQQKALNKMLKELEKDPFSTLETIHNWLCKQTDEKLIQGILKADRTLQGATKYCLGKAKEHAQNETSVMVDDNTVFQWVKEYFLLEELPKIETKGSVTTSKRKKATPKNQAQPKGKEVDEQINLFEMA